MIVALLVSTATLWIGTARFPRSLARAGFHVALLTPRGALAESSRFVHTIGHVPDGASAREWTDAFARMVARTEPAIVLPCDDMAFRLLALLHARCPAGMNEAQHRSLSALVDTSLGDPAHYLRSIDKLQLPEAATGLGVRVPEYAVIGSAAEGLPFIARSGYPVVLKRRFSTAGDGVLVCDDEAAYCAAYATLQHGTQSIADPDAVASSRLLLQRAIPGRRCFFAALAWRGALRAGWAAEVLVAVSPKGTFARSRQFEHPTLRDAVTRLAAGFGMHGIFGSEFILERDTGLPYLLEINRRVSPGYHRGSDFDVDLAATLRACLEDRPSPSRAALAPDESYQTVNFPQEWLRDPESSSLRDSPVDVPWDDPGLIAAFLRMRHVQ